VQDEREPLGRSQRVEHDQQREPHRVREHGLVFRPILDRDDGLWQRDVILAARAARAKHVEGDARDHGGQPGGEVVDRRGVGAGQPQPRLLDGVLGLAGGAEHPVGDRMKVLPLSLELLGLPVASAHVTSPRSNPSSH